MLVLLIPQLFPFKNKSKINSQTKADGNSKSSVISFTFVSRDDTIQQDNKY